MRPKCLEPDTGRHDVPSTVSTSGSAFRPSSPNPLHGSYGELRLPLLTAGLLGPYKSNREPDLHLCTLIFFKDIVSYFSGNETETAVKSRAPHRQDWLKTEICKFENFNLQGGKNINSTQVQSITDLLIFVAFFLPLKIYIRSGTPKTEIQKNEMGNIKCDRGKQTLWTERCHFSGTIQSHINSMCYSSPDTGAEQRKSQISGMMVTLSMNEMAGKGTYLS